LLLNLTTRITSSLDLREVLRAIAANIREVVSADGVAISQFDVALGKSRIFAVDFPHGKGVINEELLLTPSPAHRTAMDTLKPVVIDSRERDTFAFKISHFAAAEGVKAMCIIPLVNRGRVLGNLSILRKTETPFISEDVDSLAAHQDQ
jgi:formate hydrogenlyase transcriptional activator